MGALLDMLMKKSGPSKEKSPASKADDATDGAAYSKGKTNGGDAPMPDEMSYDRGEEDADESDDDVGQDDDDTGEGAAFDSFADHAGIAPEKRAAAKAALRTYVKIASKSNDTDAGTPVKDED